MATLLSFLVLMGSLVIYYQGRGKRKTPDKPTPKLQLASNERGDQKPPRTSRTDDDTADSQDGQPDPGRTPNGDEKSKDPFVDAQSPPVIPGGGARAARDSQTADLDTNNTTDAPPPPRPRANVVAERTSSAARGGAVPPRPSGRAGAIVDDTPTGERGDGIVFPPVVTQRTPNSSGARDRAPANATDAVPGEPDASAALARQREAPPPRPATVPRPAAAPSLATRESTSGGSSVSQIDKPAAPVGDIAADFSSRPAASVSSAVPSDWVPLPNLGKYRRPDDGPVVGTEAVLATTSGAPQRAPDDASIPAMLHTVRSNETFFSISQQYYGSGRYYRALWAANRRRVPSLDQALTVGMTIQVPPPEALDHSLFNAPAAESQAPRELIRSTPAPRSDSAAALVGGSSRGLVLPVGRPSSGIDPVSVDEFDMPPPKPTSPQSPIYIAKKGDTYRSIARDYLGTNERADEIRQLNLDAVDDPARPAAGQRLRMPLDARLPQDRRVIR